MKTIAIALCIFLFMIGAAGAKDGVYISKPDRNYSPSNNIWTPEPGDKVYFCIGCMVKAYETKKLWKVIAFNGMTYPGGISTLNFDLCYFQKDIPECMDIFIVKGSQWTGHVFSIRFFKFKILKIDTDALYLEFVGFADDQQPDPETSMAPGEKKTAPLDSGPSDSSTPESSSIFTEKKEDKGSDL